MTRQLFAIMFLLAGLFVTVGAPAAHADLTTVGSFSFSGNSLPTAPTGGFVYDDSMNEFSSITVVWNGQTYEADNVMDSISELPTTSPDVWCGEAAMMSTESCNPNGNSVGLNSVGSLNGGFYLFTNDDFIQLDPTSGSATTPDAYDTGNYVVTPEPGSASLMLIGLVGSLIAMRKRNSLSRQQEA